MHAQRQPETAAHHCHHATCRPCRINVSGCLETIPRQPAQRSGEAKTAKSQPTERHLHETHRRTHRTLAQLRPRTRPDRPPRHLVRQRQRQYPMRRLSAIHQRRCLRNPPERKQHSAAYRAPRSLRQRRLALSLCNRRPRRSPRLLRKRQTPSSRCHPAGKRRNLAQKKLALHPACRTASPAKTPTDTASRSPAKGNRFSRGC